MELEHLVRLSKFAGERFDLTQAGGGNSSAKLPDGTMLIKASGYLLSEVSLNKAYAKLNNAKLLAVLEDPGLLNIHDKKEREAYAKGAVDKALLDTSFRPSIETLLHAVLHKYVLHTHPVAVNAVTCRDTWKKELLELFPESVCVAYATPGLELTLELKKELGIYNKTKEGLPDLIFLQNHGIIIGSEKPEHIYSRYEEVTDKLANYVGLDLAKYKNSNKISLLLNSASGEYNIAYLSEDSAIEKMIREHRGLLFTPPFCPDTFVFCGMEPLDLLHLSDHEAVKNFRNNHHALPKVVLFGSQLFFIAENLKKAREMEDVFKFHILAALGAKGNIQPLPSDELSYLGNWEAEKFRQKL